VILPLELVVAGSVLLLVYGLLIGPFTGNMKPALVGLAGLAICAAWWLVWRLLYGAWRDNGKSRRRHNEAAESEHIRREAAPPALTSRSRSRAYRFGVWLRRFR
jgi:hypothetical protein